LKKFERQIFPTFPKTFWWFLGIEGLFLGFEGGI
jgi:hypothetical protein